MNELPIPAKVVATLAVLEGDADLDHFFQYSPAEFEQGMRRYAEQLQRRIDRGKGSTLAQLLSSWSDTPSSFPLKDVHPGWILEYVRHESPRVIGLVCRYLPGNQVRYIIQNLPSEIQEQLPSMNESFGIPQELLTHVRSVLENHFYRLPRPGAEEAFSCHSIPWMKPSDIDVVIRELGYEEIRLAFTGVEPKVLQAFLTRFPLKEAKEVRRRVSVGPAVQVAERQVAQKHILSADLDVKKAEDLPYEIGLSVLAECVDPRDREWITGVVVKLTPRAGYSLRRYLEERQPQLNAQQIHRRQAKLLECIRDLAERVKISSYWRSSPEDETTRSDH